MSRRSLRTVLAVLAGCAAVILVYRWVASDARRIHAVLGRIEKLASKRPGESDLSALNRARQITELFADEFSVEAEPYHASQRDRRSLAASIYRYRSSADLIASRIVDRELSVDRGAGRATCHLTAEFITGMRDLQGREAYRFQVNFVKREGDWKIDYARLLEVIEEPAPGRLF